MIEKIRLANGICNGAYTITLSSTLLGGHLTLSYLFLKPDVLALETYFTIVMGIVGTNFFYFMFLLSLQLFPIPMKVQLRKATLGMLSNIPVALFYLYILVSYEF